MVRVFAALFWHNFQFAFELWMFTISAFQASAVPCNCRTRNKARIQNTAPTRALMSECEFWIFPRQFSALKNAFSASPTQDGLQFPWHRNRFGWQSMMECSSVASSTFITLVWLWLWHKRNEPLCLLASMRSFRQLHWIAHRSHRSLH